MAAADAAARATRSSDGRFAVVITEVSANYKVATRAEGRADDVFYVRKTTMRKRDDWTQLRIGDRVELNFRFASGRAIVSDAVPLPPSPPPSPAGNSSDSPSPEALPAWLTATWTRSYIRRGTAGALGEPDSSVDVRYIQTLAGGHAFDLRVAQSFALPATVTGIDDLSIDDLKVLASGAVEAFAGVTTAVPGSGEWTFRWHAALLYPPLLGADDTPETLFESIRAGEHETSDVGLAVPTVPKGRGKRPVTRWLEHPPDGSYEEEWLMFEHYSKQGAHVAAWRPPMPGSGVGTCWLAILGNTFGFVRDIDRAALPAEVKDRPLAEVLDDDSISLAAKRKLLDADFSFGRFGQNGGVGGVVEMSSLPWRKGVALATLLGDGAADEPPWQAVRPADATMLSQALAAIRSDHEKACQQLREAEAAGQAGVVEVLRARGAV